MLRGFSILSIDTEKGVLLRYLLMAILICVICVSFWYNFKYTIKVIQINKTIFDETKTITKQERKHFFSLSEKFQSIWGIHPVIHICNGTVLLPTIKNNILFIGVSKIPGQATLIVPPLVRRAISKEFLQKMEIELSLCSQTEKALSDCVLQTLDIIHATLMEK